MDLPGAEPPGAARQAETTARANRRSGGLIFGARRPRGDVFPEESADRLDEEVGGEAEQEPGEQAPIGQLGSAELGSDPDQLHDHVKDGPSGQGEEPEVDGLVDEGLADERADEGRTAADQTEQYE